MMPSDDLPGFRHIHLDDIANFPIPAGTYDLSVEALTFKMHETSDGRETPIFLGRFRIFNNDLAGRCLWRKFWLAPRYPGHTPPDIVLLKKLSEATGCLQLPGESLYTWAAHFSPYTPARFRAPITETPSPYGGPARNAIDFLHATPVPPTAPRVKWPSPRARKGVTGRKRAADPTTARKNV
jgi:hypothetical protein